ncbi:MHF histone-fold complex component [Coemansia spiralis]|uniref:MHF histone-fold complex component n=1 Tax=Coemansia spiralis TaxID=417178 RepID=A0A9W8L0V9_9FUNG|nr:MHF histone-fold complex component [Coemansia spiralis]
MNADTNDAHAAIWFTVAQLCNEDEKKSSVKFSPAFVDALSQVVYSQTETMGVDLEHFAKHAKRAKISVDDVKAELLAAKAEAIKTNAAKPA